MVNRQVCAILALLLVAAVLLAGCSSTNRAGQGETTVSPAYMPQRMTPGDLRDLVKDAAAFARVSGREAALAEFSKKDGRFSHGDIYVYAYDSDGTLLAHPYQGDQVGQNRLNFTDIRGLRLIAMANYTAAAGGGFLAYLYPAPAGGVIDEAAKDSYVPKIGYVYPVDTSWWVGSGIYFSDLEGASPVPETVAAMIDLEQKGADYGRKNGRDKAFSEISNRSGIFVDSWGHYLTGYDYDGTVLSHPYLQDAIGKSLAGRKDAFGMEIVRSAADTAKAGGGYVIFIWPNPAAGNQEETKIGYMLPVDGTWWIGSGVYLSEITGEPTYYPAHPV
ncbi:MAG: cache domain-containing protein [Methanoregulaceae archaeon]|nr:cache domain-containing protein [Methanoregulaceae archaeon]